MQDFITLGTAPVDEPCAQIGQDDYYDKVKEECRRFIRLLRRKFGDEPPGARFALDEAAAHYAYRCEDELPATWEG